MLLDRRREDKIISIVSKLLKEEDLTGREGERDSWMKLNRKACFVERSRALVGIIKLNRSFRTCREDEVCGPS